MPTTPSATRDARLDGFLVVVVLAGVMWVAEIADVVAGHRLDELGIEPRTSDGLVGVAAAPFLHAGFGHLIANTIPFVAMGLTIAFKGAVRVIAVTAIVALASGLGTWLVASEGTVHIGASGVVFGYGSYLLARGFFDRDALELAIAALVAVVWGGALVGGLLPEEGISWQSHVFGALGGVLAARLLAPGQGGEVRRARA